MTTRDVHEYLNVPGNAVHVVERTEDGEPTAVLARLAQIAPWLHVMSARCGDGPCPRTRPMGRRSHGEITFVGPLEGRQLEPFVETLRALATGDIDYDTPATPGRLAELSERRYLTVAVSATCPYCPSVAAAALRIALTTPYVDVVIARADLGFGGPVTSVPRVSVNGQVVAEGPIGEFGLVEKVIVAPEGDDS